MSNTFINKLAINLLGPATKAFGKNAGIMVDGATKGMALWGKERIYKYKQQVFEFSQEVYIAKQQIPKDKLKDPEINIAGPIFESSFYYFDEKYYKNLFKNLLVSSSNTNFSSEIHPCFVDIIKQLSPLDAKFLNQFNFFSIIPIIHVYFEKNSSYNFSNFYFIDFQSNSSFFTYEEEKNYKKSVENLKRLGLISEKYLVDDLDFNLNLLEKHPIYINISNKIQSNTNIKLNKFALELSELGKSFANCCF